MPHYLAKEVSFLKCYCYKNLYPAFIKQKNTLKVTYK